MDSLKTHKPLQDMYGNIHRKEIILESLFDKVASLVTLLKRDHNTGIFM